MSRLLGRLLMVLAEKPWLVSRLLGRLLMALDEKPWLVSPLLGRLLMALAEKPCLVGLAECGRLDGCVVTNLAWLTLLLSS